MDEPTETVSGYLNYQEMIAIGFSQILNRREAAMENVGSSEFFSSKPRKDAPPANPFLSPDYVTQSTGQTGDYSSAIGMLTA